MAGHWSLDAKTSIYQPFHEQVASDYLLIDKTALRGNTGVLWGSKQLVAEAADTYSLDYSFYSRIINCECGFDRKHESCLGDSGLAYGRLQFHKPTFMAYCEGNYKNERDQIFCGAKMISQGQGRNWTCWSNLIKTYGDRN